MSLLALPKNISLNKPLASTGFLNNIRSSLTAFSNGYANLGSCALYGWYGVLSPYAVALGQGNGRCQGRQCISFLRLTTTMCLPPCRYVFSSACPLSSQPPLCSHDQGHKLPTFPCPCRPRRSLARPSRRYVPSLWGASVYCWLSWRYGTGRWRD